jgi:phage repressor protein C with HTH and peptisase S24 domain
MNKDLILNRIKEANKLASDKELADFLGISKSTLSNWYKRNSIDYDLVFSKCEQLDMDWLLTGNGKMYKNDNQQKAYTNKTVIESVVSEPTENNERKLIPFFDAVTLAGTQAVVNMDAAYPVEMVDAGDFFQDATAIMAVHGESMFPDYKPGSLVALKEVYDKRLVMLGEDYVIETSEYRVIKRIQRDEDKTCWLACSTNIEMWEQGPLKGRLIHEPFPIPIDDVRRLYLVLGQIHRNHSNKIIFSNK